MRITLASSITIAGLALAGCSNHYLLSSQFVASTQTGKEPEIIETPFYLTERTKIRTVAVRAPDSCSNQTADQATGQAASQGTILQTNCGVEMAEIEKSLAKMGYRVISWKVLAREMGKNQSATDSAAALGAEVIFQINSLEKSQKTLGKDARWERKYYLSNDNGSKVEERAFDDATRTHFKKNYLENFENNIDTRRQAVTLDANAVYVKTGESIWYYRWTHTDPTAIDYRKEILIQCKSNNRECLKQTPVGEQAIQTNMTTAGESEAVSITEKFQDIEKAKYAELLSSVIDNLVKSFSKNEMVPYVPLLTPALAAIVAPQPEAAPAQKVETVEPKPVSPQAPPVETAIPPVEAKPASRKSSSRKAK